MAGAPLGLSSKLANRLAELNGASREAIETTIALWPLGARISLAAHQIIDTHPDEEAARDGETTDFMLTEHGLEVIEQCARWQESGDSGQVAASSGARAQASC